MTNLKIIFFAFVLFIFSISIFAQENSRAVRFYVPPIDGIGVIDDMAYFYKQITAEILLQNRTLGKTRPTSDYVITGKLMPIEDAGIELPPGAENDENILFVQLYDNINGMELGTQFVTYRGWPDATTNESLAVVIYNMLAGIPDFIGSSVGGETWRHKWLYANASFLWAPRAYIGERQALNMAGVGAEIELNVLFLSFMGAKLGAQITQDYVPLIDQGKEITQAIPDMIIGFPVSIFFALRPGELLFIKPYLGAVANLSLWKYTTPYPVSWMTGANFGVKVGPGIITFDTRFTMDFNQSYITETGLLYWRYGFHLGLGYKYGFIDRKQK